MKKLLSLVLALVLVLALAAPVFADTPSDQKDNLTINITGTLAKKTYTVYRILDLATYDQSLNAYRYVLASDATVTVEEFLALSATVDGATHYVNEYLKVDEKAAVGDDKTQYIVWANSNTAAADNAAAQQLAQILLANAKDKFAVAGTKTTAEENETVTFTVTAGYYLVDSSTGVLCGMDTAQKEGESTVVNIAEKNVEPGINKTVKEGNDWIESDSVLSEDEPHSHANIGDKVEFKTEIYVKKGAENYVLHDTMSAGFTFNNDIVVKNGETTLTLGTDYTVKTANAEEEADRPTDNCTFEVIFTETYLDTHFGQTNSPEATLTVTYSATLNENAVIDGDGNTNITHLDYGNVNHTREDLTRTFSFDFNIHKYGTNYNNEDHNVQYLADAKFTLYKDADCTDAVKLEDLTGGAYRVNSENGTETTIVTVSTGNVSIKGLDAGTYYLKETEAPAGFNLMDEIVEVRIDNNGKVYFLGDAAEDTDSTVDIENRTGDELPSTGGIGTTIFYVVGGILVAAAAILFVTKKRMSASEN